MRKLRHTGVHELAQCHTAQWAELGLEASQLGSWMCVPFGILNCFPWYQNLIGPGQEIASSICEKCWWWRERNSGRKGSNLAMNESIGKKLVMITFTVESGCWGTNKGPIQVFGLPSIRIYDIIYRVLQGPLFSAHQASLGYLLFQYFGWAPLPS